VLVVLALILGWRMFGGRAVARKTGAGPPRAKSPSRRDSEFLRKFEKGLPHAIPGETHAAWLHRVSTGLPT